MRTCPTCKKRFEPPKELADGRPQHAPFCSERCKLSDLSRWLRGEYSIASSALDEGDGDGAVADAED